MTRHFARQLALVAIVLACPSGSAIVSARSLADGQVGESVLVAPIPAPGVASEPLDATDPDAAARRALEFERQRRWASAIELYEEAVELWPGRAEFRHRLRLCELHFRLGRRYQDQSFRGVLLRLSREQAIALYDEVLEWIGNQYVEPVAWEPLVRRGLDNLEVALRDPVFLKANAPDAPASRVQWLRDAYRSRRDRIVAKQRTDARTWALDACDLANKALGVNATPILLEFTFGACDALDDYSSYLTPEKLDDLYSMIDGNFVGLGVELKWEEESLKLVGVIRGGPAHDAGLRAGDRITHVAGTPVRGLGLDEAAGRLQGEEGTAIELTVARSGAEALELRLVRRHVEVQSVAEAEMIDRANGVGYVQLTGFQKSSTQELTDAIHALQRQGLRYLVLDLRGNPGGLLKVAVEISDLFLDQGIVVTTRGRGANQSSVYRAHRGTIWSGPVAILVDHDSASASEILAGALKDNNRAVVLGERSFGKGSVQSIFPLRTAPAGLKLTTAKFYSPLDRPYSENGVEPNVAVRVAARPPGLGPVAEGPALPFGDPAFDSVLDMAIQLARRQLSSSR